MERLSLKGQAGYPMSRFDRIALAVLVVAAICFQQ